MALRKFEVRLMATLDRLGHWRHSFDDPTQERTEFFVVIWAEDPTKATERAKTDFLRRFECFGECWRIEDIDISEPVRGRDD